ncbi:MAG: UDP-N-acetylglucosamine--N-acetylmuramyl-(pentapeptide) pyrophosphoryl-undecaprenol N-acetylglucosamine transferase [Acidimicrobiales bacterium]|jgi:UDP-N-acetylglucosamine--N-acetylmuramyl-(pentapeptide) pyrophosphoryl-undecaprenol N-acetylglucosamine transferase
MTRPSLARMSLVRSSRRLPPQRACVVVAGGGTGGHIYPGVALARELASRGHDPASIRFVGSKRGLEAKTRATGEFPTTLLPGRGWQRGRQVRQGLANAGALADAGAAVAITMALFSRWRPAVVVSFGGYASFPCVVAAAIWGVPVVVVNLDSVPGLVNRLASKIAVASAEGVPRHSPPGPPHWRRRTALSVFTGVPVRPEMACIDRSPEGRRRARERLGVPSGATVVAVCGGSLGALRINEATAQLAGLWGERDGTVLRHVVGRRDWERFAKQSPQSSTPISQNPISQNPISRAVGLVYQVVEYEEDMASLYAAADIAVQRAGASSVAELALAGLPSILVPLPGAPGDHQGANARAMARAGGAVVVEDGRLDGARLASELDDLLSRPEHLARMGEAARSLARPSATSDLADLVLGCARGARWRETAAGRVAPSAR